MESSVTLFKKYAIEKPNIDEIELVKLLRTVEMNILSHSNTKVIFFKVYKYWKN